MNQRTKTLLAILIFTVFIAAVYFIYTVAAANYRPEEKELNDRTEAVETDSDGTDIEGETNTAPDFTVYDEEGNAYLLSDILGEPIVLNFWASWCPP